MPTDQSRGWQANISGLHWESDWNGDDVGYPELNVVGMYTSVKLGIHVYIDMDANEVIEVMMMDEEEL